jgi:hypothetical protein
MGYIEDEESVAFKNAFLNYMFPHQSIETWSNMFYSSQGLLSAQKALSQLVDNTTDKILLSSAFQNVNNAILSFINANETIKFDDMFLDDAPFEVMIAYYELLQSIVLE